MKLTKALMSGLALASLFMAGLPGEVIAQSQPAPAQNVAAPNSDQLLISMDDTKPTALLGGESVITGKVKNTGNATQYNVGWTVKLPQGVDYLGAKAGPGDYGSPKATILLYPNGRTETVVHWANAADISAGEELTFEIRVKNSAPEGDTPPAKGKFFKLEETMTFEAWAKGSRNAAELPKFQEYGYAPGYNNDPTWAKDTQAVQIKGLETKLIIEDQLNGVTIRGNKENQRQRVTVELERTKYGQLDLSGPVSVDLEPVWEVMGTCVKNGENCFEPTDADLQWDQGKWKLNIPAEKFVFDEHKAKVTFEIAALDKDNVEPTAGQKKVNMAGLGGDGAAGGAMDDVARRDEAYANNTGKASQNFKATIDASSTARYVHPWHGANQTEYPNHNNLGVDFPEISTRVEDTSVTLTTSMVGGGPYKNNALADKKLVIRTNEYTPLAADRQVVITLSEPECPVAKGTDTCVTNGTIKVARTVIDANGRQTTDEVDGTVVQGSDKKYTVTIPAVGIDPGTSTTQNFHFQAKVQETANGKEVVNGKPLPSKALLSWTDSNRIEVEATSELPPAPLDILNTVAFPATGGACPPAMTGMPSAEERKALKDQPENDRLAEQVNDTDIWGKRRKVGTDKELCFQVLMKFPDGIVTKDPKLNLFLPPEAELSDEPATALQFSGSIAGQVQLEGSSNIDTAKKPVPTPDKRTPLTYTLGSSVPGGALLSVVYKAKIKNTKLPDTEQPDVIYDNLAKLGYTDFDGGFSNVRDLAGYEFINPILMVEVDKPLIENVARGSQHTLTYTVTNIGDSPAATGTKVAVKLPEGVSCSNVAITNGATKDDCVEGLKSGQDPKLISGDYLLVTLDNGVGSKDPNSNADQTKFSLQFTVPNNHVPGTSYEVPAGIVGYKSVSALQQALYIPKKNAFCKPQATGLTAEAAEREENTCAEKIAASIFNVPSPGTALGKTVFVAPDKATGGLSTAAVTRVSTAKGSISMSGTTTDTRNDEQTNPRVVVPGEKGKIELTIRPNGLNGQAPSSTTLDGPLYSGNDAYIAVAVIGTNPNDAQYVASANKVKDAFVQALGSDVVNENGVTSQWTTSNQWFYTIPLKKLPAEQKTVNLTDLFTATSNNVIVQASINHKPLVLGHRDLKTSAINQPAPSSVARVHTPATQQVFPRKAPALEVIKQVADPTSNRIAGNSRVTYTVTIRNTSDVPAYRVNVTDTLPATFTHDATITRVDVTGGVDSTLTNNLAWHRTEADRKGVWPSGAQEFMIPARGSITLTYVASAPQLVTADEAFTNHVVVPFASQPSNVTLGVLTGSGEHQATVRANPINSTTIIENQHNRHNHPDRAIQPGDVVTTTTTIVIPSRVKVPNLSVLTTLGGGTFNRDNAKVVLECPQQVGLDCNANSLLAGDAHELGVNLKNGEFENTTDQTITVKVKVTDLLVTAGDGPITAKGDAYTGATAPNSLAELKGMTRTSDGSTGSVPIKTPALQVTAQLLEGASKTPVTSPIEPGTDITARITITNTVPGSTAYAVQVQNLIDQLAAKGFTPKPGFQNAVLANKTVTNGSPVEIEIPLAWDHSKFTGTSKLSGNQSIPVPVSGQSGPFGVVAGAAAPETTGVQVDATSDLTYSPLYPVPAVSVGITKLDGGVLSTENPPVLKVGDEAKVTFTPTITGAKGYNPVLCVKAENIDGSVGKAHALANLELHEPASGVELVTSGTACASGEIEVKLPENVDGKTLPPVSFKVTSSGGAITEIMNTKISATLKVSSQIDRGTTDQPGPREFTANTDQKVDVSPSVDIKVTSQWLKTDGTPFGDGEPAVYNDYDTETKPVKAKISIQNIGSDAATPQGSTVTVKIPTGFTIEGNPDKNGWNCQVDTQTGESLLICSRNEDLPGNQTQPFEVTIQSPSGPGVRLTTDPLVIRGGHNDNRGAVSPFDHNPSNDQVNTTAKVNIPKPDFAPEIQITDKLRKDGVDIKPFTVEVTHDGDPVRAHELKVRIDGDGDNPTFAVKNPNGWHCSDTGIFIDCAWPNAIGQNAGKLPKIELTANMGNIPGDGKLRATTEWRRTSAVAQSSVKVEDKEPGNDISRDTFVPFSGWVDAEVKVSFENPTPNAGEDPKPKVTISHVDGGKDIPVGTKVQVTVPPTAQVQDSAKVNSCTQKSADGNAVTYECQLVETIAPGVKVEGPNITGVAGPNQKIDAKVVLPEDPKQSNNEDSATTRNRQVPPVAPVPSDVPSPKPEDRPTTIPPAPEPPAKPAPAKPGHTPTPKPPEERSNDWVEAVFPDNTKSRIVLIGRDNVFADSLSSGGLQGILDAPLLLNPVSHLSDKTKAALDRLQPEEVIILGGPVAQSPAVEEELIKLGWNVSRVAGPTRVETAIDAATVHAPTATHGILARAYSSDWGSGTQAFADALAGGALAARQQRPVFLTPTGELTDSLRTYLAKAKVKHLTVVGSTEAVSPAVEAELHKMGITTERIAGANRAETAVKVANSLGYWHAGEAEAALVVNGESEDAWTDAFPAALYAKRYELPVLLSGTDELLPETKQWIGPGIYRKPPTRVICGFSVGNVKECAFSPTKAPELQPDRPANN